MTAAQKRAVRKYRSRIAKRGLSRFEVLGRKEDRDFIRSLARRMAGDPAEAARIVKAVDAPPDPALEPDARGGIWRALRASPLVGAKLDLRRPKRAKYRKVEF